MPTSVAINGALLIVLIGLALHWKLERLRLRRFLSATPDLPVTPRDAALHLAGVLAARGGVAVDPPYLTVLLRPLGATPGAILRHGGCCSGASRLYILCLAEMGIRAHQITVYTSEGLAQHCLVEVLLDDGPLIADPIYGIRYEGADCRPIGLEALQMGVPVSFAPLPIAGKASYPNHSYYRFDFAQTKTANWTKSWQRRFAYHALKIVGRERADRLRVPALFEWPQVLLGIGLLSGRLIVGVLLVLAHSA